MNDELFSQTESGITPHRVAEYQMREQQEGAAKCERERVERKYRRLGVEDEEMRRKRLEAGDMGGTGFPSQKTRLIPNKEIVKGYRIAALKEKVVKAAMIRREIEKRYEEHQLSVLVLEDEHTFIADRKAFNLEWNATSRLLRNEVAVAIEGEMSAVDALIEAEGQ